jgi:hypothetical protein
MTLWCGRLFYLLLALSTLVSRMPAQDYSSYGPRIQGSFPGKSPYGESAPSTDGSPMNYLDPDAALVIPGLGRIRLDRQRSACRL